MLRNLNQSASGKRILGVPQAGILAAQIASETAEGDHGPGILYNESQDAGYAGKYLRAAVTNWPSTGTLFVYENGNFEADGLPDGLHTFGYDLYVDGVYDSASSFDVTVGALTLSALTTSNVTSSGCTASVSISNNAAGTLYLAAYPSDQTPTWTRPNWSGTPTYSDSDTDSGSGSTFQWSPDVSGLSAGQEYKLWAIWDDGSQSSNGGAPISSAAFTTSYALTGENITADAPTLGAPTLTQNHAITGAGITAGAPALGAPTIISAAGNDALTGAGITAGTPTLGAPTLTQNHALAGGAIAAGSPTFGTPSLAQIHAIMSAGITAGAPALGAPTLSTAALGSNIWDSLADPIISMLGTQSTLDGQIVSAVFDAAYADIYNAAGSRPVATVLASLPASRGSAFAHGGSSYTVAAIEPDGHGLKRLILETA